MNMRRIVRRISLAACAVLATIGSGPAVADTIRVNYVPTTDGLTLFVAKDQGLFANRGLDVKLTAAPSPSVMISALASGSSDVAHTVLIPVLAATQAGIKLSVFAGASGFPTIQPPTVGVIARKDSGIKSPMDLKGKTIGVVGLEAYHQVMVQRWMRENDADFKSVRFVEVPFPQMQDLLSAGNVDAVVSVDPFYSRMINAGVGYTFGDFVKTMPAGVPIVVFVSTREWSEKNPKQVAAFRDALIEAADFIKTHEAEARKSLATWTKLPEPVIATSRWGNYYAKVGEENIQYWIDLMKRQDMLTDEIKASDLIPPVFK